MLHTISLTVTHTHKLRNLESSSTFGCGGFCPLLSPKSVKRLISGYTITHVLLNFAAGIRIGVILATFPFFHSKAKAQKGWGHTQKHTHTYRASDFGEIDKHCFAPCSVFRSAFLLFNKGQASFRERFTALANCYEIGIFPNLWVISCHPLLMPARSSVPVPFVRPWLSERRLGQGKRTPKLPGLFFSPSG